MTPLGLAVLASACDPVVTADYRGEPVFSIRGSLVGDASSAPPLDLVIAWLGVDALTKNELGAFDLDVQRLAIQTKTDVAGSFPAQFELSIFEPPPLLMDASTLTNDDALAAVIGDGVFAMGLILVIDQQRPPQLSYAELIDAAFHAGAMPERVYGVSTATVFYTEDFAFGPGDFLPGALAQDGAGFIVVEPLQGAMARAWLRFAPLREGSWQDYAARWSACVEEACIKGDDTCNLDCAIANDVDALDQYDVARAACEDACDDEGATGSGYEACASACQALDPMVRAQFPGEPVVIEGDELLRLDLREPGA